VFHSKYFEKRIKFPSGEKFDEADACDLKTVTLQTEHGYEEGAKRRRPFREWMLCCKLEKNEVPFEYWLSHAYVFDQIFVYHWPKESEYVFLEALATEVRLNFDPNRAHFADIEHVGDISKAVSNCNRL